MRILVCGASGFVGGSLVAALGQAGHDCVRGVRKLQQASDIAVDYMVDTSPEVWVPRLAGVDAVINAVGVLRDTGKTPMARLHVQAPSAMFAACATAGVQKVVNISALGVTGPLETAYFSTKAQAEQALRSHGNSYRWLNLRPSVIYGENGASAKMFRQLASLPVHMLPCGGRQAMQPVHIHDVCAAVLNWLERPESESSTVTVAGSEVVDYRAMLDSYREQQGRGKALHVHVPTWMVKTAARLGDVIPASPLCSDTLAMLQQGNVGDNSGFAALLGRRPLGVSEFLGA